MTIAAAMAWPTDIPVAGRADVASSPPSAAWALALLAASVLAVDPIGLGGVRLRARPGPVRDRWLAEFTGLFGPAVPVCRVSSTAPDAAFIGGLDVGRTLALGRRVAEQGVLARVHGGVLVLGMAERATASLAATLGAALDPGEVRVERDGLSDCQPACFTLIALDEGIDEEGIPASLADRLGLLLDLDAIGWRETAATCPPGAVDTARLLLPAVTVAPSMTEALSSLALAYGGASLRLPLQLLRAARACAALRGAVEVKPEDAASALRLVFGLPPPADVDGEDPSPESEMPGDPPQGQAERPAEGAVPSAETLRPPSPPTPPRGEPPGAPGALPEKAAAADNARADPSSPEALQDMLVAAVGAALPADLLAQPRMTPSGARRPGAAGKAGQDRVSSRRGRVIGVTATPPTPGARPDVLATLRQAAPWQRLRSAGVAAGTGPAGGQPLQIRAQDFRYLRRRERTGSTAIFAVDASGSAAVERLAETKGAIELLLADCYVRRDSVGLIAFRGPKASTLLEPTRSLTRARRSLADLPGGGGTPLASGIMAALQMATAAGRKGQSVITVFLTDGRGNVALDGGTLREQVAADTAQAARLFRRLGLRAIVIDIARREQPRAQELSLALGAEYLALPRGGAGAMARVVGARMEG